MSMTNSLFSLACTALAAPTPDEKLTAMDALAQAAAEPWIVPAPRPALARGQFARWQVVEPGKLPKRSPHTLAGRAGLLHAIAHIEYSAIDLALDHALRFDGLPDAYYRDWLKVALDEARHFRLLREHLRTLGHDYGDFPVHDGLWQMAEKTTGDVLARMAMVPRLLEARGLDATPPIQRKLAEAGDENAVRVLDVILHDEEDHVRLGDHWFRHLCAERGLPVEPTFRELIVQYAGPWPQTPMNENARLAAGFSAQELADLTAHRPAR